MNITHANILKTGLVFISSLTRQFKDDIYSVSWGDGYWLCYYKKSKTLYYMYYSDVKHTHKIKSYGQLAKIVKLYAG